jgi:hypothetical protein
MKAPRKLSKEEKDRIDEAIAPVLRKVLHEIGLDEFQSVLAIVFPADPANFEKGSVMAWFASDDHTDFLVPMLRELADSMQKRGIN